MAGGTPGRGPVRRLHRPGHPPRRRAPLRQVLFHESGHPNLGDHVACPKDFAFTDCPNCTETTETACDADDQGTFALESSVLALWAKSCNGETEPETCAYLDEAQAVAEDLATAF